MTSASEKPRIIAIVGPTAIGKTDCAIRLAARLRGEIISCDSMQVYRGMAILSQAPGRTRMKGIKHHLVGCISPGKNYSVAAFRAKAAAAVRAIIRRKKVPVIVGGSGLYIKALVDGLFPSPPADRLFRKRMERFAARYGARRVHARLAKIDPACAATIHPHDLRRTIRALELHHTTGRTMTALKALTKGLADRYDIRIFGLTAPRAVIYGRIDRRVDRMFDEGACDEVRKLMRRRLGMTAGAALGLKEISGYLDGAYGPDEARRLLKMHTRRFAKRQLTWFRADKRIKWFDVTALGPSRIAAAIQREVR